MPKSTYEAALRSAQLQLEQASVLGAEYYDGKKIAGTRARSALMKGKELLQKARIIINDDRKSGESE